MSLNLEDLTICPEGIDPVCLLADWEWAMDSLLLPVLITAMGDVFAQSESGGIWFVDVTGGEIVPVCESAEAFEDALDDDAFIDEFFKPRRVQDLREAGLVLPQRHVFSHRLPLVIGGQDDIASFETSDAIVHVSIHGQIHRQVHDLPEGAPIGKLKINPPNIP